MRITYGGHSCVLIDFEGKVLAIDPWLDNPRGVESLKQLKIDGVFLTHGHPDHTAGVVELCKKFSCPCFGIVELIQVLQLDGLPKDLGVALNKGGAASLKVLGLNDSSVVLTHAIHSSSYILNDQLVYAGEACGIVLILGDKSIYHAGDTALFADMDWINYRFQPDVAFLPIGDFYTMGPEDAAEAASIIQAKYTVPIHWGTFPQLSGTPEKFQQCCKEEEVQSEIKILEPGASFTL